MKTFTWVLIFTFNIISYSIEHTNPPIFKGSSNNYKGQSRSMGGLNNVEAIPFLLYGDTDSVLKECSLNPQDLTIPFIPPLEFKPFELPLLTEPTNQQKLEKGSLSNLESCTVCNELKEIDEKYKLEESHRKARVAHYFNEFKSRNFYNSAALEEELVAYLNYRFTGQDHSGAQRLIHCLTLKYPDSPNTALVKVKWLIKKGNLSQARTLASEYINKFSNNAVFKLITKEINILLNDKNSQIEAAILGLDLILSEWDLLVTRHLSTMNPY